MRLPVTRPTQLQEDQRERQGEKRWDWVVVDVSTRTIQVACHDFPGKPKRERAMR